MNAPASRTGRARLARPWIVAWRIVRLTVRAQAEYRAEFAVTIASGALWQTSIVVFATVVLTRFPAMGSWSSADVLLIASCRMLAHGLYVLFFGRMPFDFEELVHDGQVLSFLLRPMPVYRQAQLSKFPTNAIGDLAVAVFLVVLAVGRSSIVWTPARVAFLVAGVAGGALVEAAISTAFGAAMMHRASTGNWATWVHELIDTFGGYPLSILPNAAGSLLTYVLPLAFIAYLPIGVISGHAGELGVPRWLAIGSPLAGIVLFVLSRLLFNASVRRYAQAGT